MENDNQLSNGIKHQLDRMEDGSFPALDGLTSNDLHQLLYHTFEADCLLQYRSNIPNEVIKKIPFYQLSVEYLHRIDDAGELKLTTNGNLRPKLCKDLYSLGIIKEKYIESGVVKLNREADSLVLTNLKIISNLSGITKNRNNKLSLTKKGKQLYQSDRAFDLFRTLFETNIFKFNLGYHDGYPQESGIQQLLPFTLYLLLKYGKEQREIDFYIEKNLTAFPSLVMDFTGDWSSPEKQFRGCYKVRVFERCLDYYGFVDLEIERIPEQFEEKVRIEASELYRQIFEIKS